ncbi:MAG: amidohydrolase family protein [Candidatus Cyclobacteriaceae bacterium M2_1C_046]
MKISFIKRSILLLLFIISGIPAIGQRYVLHCGNLIDVEEGKVRQKVTVIVEGNKITAVNNGYTSPQNGDSLIDLTNKFVMPGLMDMHVHLEGETNPGSYIQKFTLNEADIAFNAALYAKKTLMAGFTTVRDLGGTGVNTALRKAIDRGAVIGPRVYSAGKSIATTGGHADPTNSYRKDLMGDPGPAEGVINSPEEARKAVRQRYKDGADVIKITATGGVLSVAKDGSGPQFTMEELKAIVQTANDYGMVTAAHAHGAEGMKRAVEAGINSIEHGTMMTPEVMDLMKEKGTYYVPTISAGKFVAEKAKVEGYYPAVVVPKALEVGPQIQGTFQEAYKRGVKIAFGTDAGVFPHGDNAKEFQYMVEVGMKPMEAIQSATITAAQLLKEEDKLGSVSTGKMADIIAVEGDPLKDITLLQNVSFIMKNGQVYKYKK